MAKKASETIKSDCTSCERETNQTILYRSDPVYDSDIPAKYQWVRNTFNVIQCLGCSTISFLQIESRIGRRAKDSITFHHNFPETDHWSETDYDFLTFEDQEELPKTIAYLYSEIEDSFECDSAILSGIGLRTLVEAICLDQNIPGSNLEKKIRGLFDKGLISSAELPILDKLRLIGNFSAHSIKSLPMSKLDYALSIVNHVLKSIYVFPKLNKGLVRYMDKSNSTNKKK